jgi:hypothetical protein
MVLGRPFVTANGMVPGSHPRKPRNHATNGDAMKTSLNGHKTHSSNLSDSICEKTITARMIGIMQKDTAAKTTIQKIVFMVFGFMQMSLLTKSA